MSISAAFTRLQAVNICLSSLGEPEIDTLDGGGFDAEAAERLLDEVSRRIQLRGFWFNREIHKISPDQNGNLLIPDNTLSIDTTGQSSCLDLVQRGSKLFDREVNTYAFSNPVEVELIVLLDWDELPYPAKQAIAYLAAAELQTRLIGSADQDKQLSARAKEAYSALISDDVRNSDANMLTDSWDVARALYRGGR